MIASDDVHMFICNMTAATTEKNKEKERSERLSYMFVLKQLNKSKEARVLQVRALRAQHGMTVVEAMATIWAQESLNNNDMTDEICSGTSSSEIKLNHETPPVLDLHIPAVETIRNQRKNNVKYSNLENSQSLHDVSKYNESLCKKYWHSNSKSECNSSILLHSSKCNHEKNKNCSVKFAKDNEMYDINDTEELSDTEELQENNSISKSPTSKDIKKTIVLAKKLCQKLDNLSQLHTSEMLNTTIMSKLDELHDVMQQGGSLDALQVISEDVRALQRSAEKSNEEEQEWKDNVRKQLLDDIETVANQCVQEETKSFTKRLHNSLGQICTQHLSPQDIKDVILNVMEGLEKVQISEHISTKNGELLEETDEEPPRQFVSNHEQVPLQLVVVRTVRSLQLFLDLFPQHSAVESVLQMKTLLQNICENLAEEELVANTTTDINTFLLKIIQDIERNTVA